MDIMFVGGLIRFLQGLGAAAPTMIVGLFVAGLLKYYLGRMGRCVCSGKWPKIITPILANRYAFAGLLRRCHSNLA